MADEVIVIVDTDGTQNPDYTSLSAAITGEATNLVTADEQLTIECRATTGTADTTAVTMSGFTTNSECFVKIFVPLSHRHNGKWSTGKYRLSVTTNLPLISIPASGGFAYTEIIGLQFDHLYPSNVAIPSINNYHTNLLLDRCLFNYNIRIACAIGLFGNSNNSRIHNCICLGYANATWATITGYSNTSSTSNIRNCTFYNEHTVVWRGQNTDTLNFINTIAANYTLFYYGGGTTGISLNYCATDDGYGTNAVTLDDTDDYVNEFEDASGGDLMLVADSGCVDEGTSLSDYFTIDIIGTSRPQGSAWDIGAFELEQATPSVGINYQYNDAFVSVVY